MTNTEMAIKELLKNHERSNQQIANIDGCSKCSVGYRRQKMEKNGLIPVWRGKGQFDEKIREELLKDHERTNLEIARIVECGPGLVPRVRRKLEKDGTIDRFRGNEHSTEEQNPIIDTQAGRCNFHDRQCNFLTVIEILILVGGSLARVSVS